MVTWWIFLLASSVAAFGFARSSTIPPLVRYDDHEKCFREHNPGVFCIARVILKQEVDPIDSHRIMTDYRSNLLERGVCVQKCEKELSNLSAEELEQLYYPKFLFNHELYLNPTRLWKDELEPFEHRYSRLMNICINNRLLQKHNVSQLWYTEIEYCMTNETPSNENVQPMDWWKITFCLLATTLIGTFLLANVVDSLGGAHLKELLVVSSFSVRRNWVRFMAESKSQLQQDFNYIDGMRVIISLIVMYVHCSNSLLWPAQNTDEIEEKLRNPLIISVFSGSGITVQIFFVVGGLLLTVNFLKDTMCKPNLERRYFRSKIFNRLMRIVPMYYFFLLFATVVASLHGSKLSPVRVMPMVKDQYVCRSYGWTNALFINNLPFVGECCLIHGWYLGADMQLFLWTLTLLAIMWKFPKTTKPILWLNVAAGLIIPAWVTHSRGLEPLVPMRLSDVIAVYNYQPWMRHIYMPGYTNLNSYAAGMVVGYLYHQTKHNKLILKSCWLYRLLKDTAIPLAIFTLVTIPVYYFYEIKPSWLTLLHSVLIRNYAIVCCCICLCENFQNPPGFFRRILSSQLLSRLGKVTYSVYVLHVGVLQVVFNRTAEIGDLSESMLLQLVAVVIALSYLAGFLAYFVIEQPICLLLMRWYSGKSKAKEQ